MKSNNLFKLASVMQRLMSADIPWGEETLDSFNDLLVRAYNLDVSEKEVSEFIKERVQDVLRRDCTFSYRVWHHDNDGQSTISMPMVKELIDQFGLYTNKLQQWRGGSINFQISPVHANQTDFAEKLDELLTELSTRFNCKSIDAGFNFG